MLLSEIFKKERPRVITAVGYIFGGAGILMVAVGMMALVMFAVISRFGPIPEDSGPFSFVFVNFRYFALGEVIVGILMFLASCNFLLGKNWSRFVLQAFFIAYFIFMMVFCVVWGYSWVGLAPNLVFKLYGAFIATYLGLYWGVISIITIVFLNGKTVKQFCMKRETPKEV